MSNENKEIEKKLTAREFLAEKKKESEFVPDWMDSGQEKYFVEYSKEAGKWQCYWTWLYDFGAFYFSQEEVEEIIETLNEEYKEGWGE